jgi:hypothetical protein
MPDLIDCGTVLRFNPWWTSTAWPLITSILSIRATANGTYAPKTPHRIYWIWVDEGGMSNSIDISF